MKKLSWCMDGSDSLEWNDETHRLELALNDNQEQSESSSDIRIGYGLFCILIVVKTMNNDTK